MWGELIVSAFFLEWISQVASTGSNGVRNRLWKKKLQDLADEEQLAMTVVQYPPATSKWNKLEHRLCSFISITWRASPLPSLEVV